MRKLTNLTHYKQDYFLTLYFLIAIHVMVLIAVSFEYFIAGGLSFLLYAINIFGLMLFFNAYYRSLKELLYTFWGLSIPAHGFLLYSFFYSLSYQETAVPSYIYLASILIHWMIFYLISAPVFFPQMRWWEYDFRFRGDLPATLVVNDRAYECRLIDLRRGGGGLVLFEDLDVGVVGDVEVTLGQRRYQLSAVLISSTTNVPGRGFTYGVRFLLKTRSAKKDYYLLRFRWLKHTQAKLKQRMKMVA